MGGRVKKLLILLGVLFLSFPALGQLPAANSTSTSGIWAEVPSPRVPNKFYYATDYGVSGALLHSNGTRWKPYGGCTVLATLDAPSSPIADTETIVFQYLMPANLLHATDRLRVVFTISKNGATDSAKAIPRMGILGTTSDDRINPGAGASNILSAANRNGAFFWDFRSESATSIQQLAANTAGNGSYGFTGNGALFAAPATISSTTTNPIYFSLGINSTGATNTVALQEAQLNLCTGAN